MSSVSPGGEGWPSWAEAAHKHWPPTDYGRWTTLASAAGHSSKLEKKKWKGGCWGDGLAGKELAWYVSMGAWLSSTSNLHIMAWAGNHSPGEIRQEVPRACSSSRLAESGSTTFIEITCLQKLDGGWSKITCYPIFSNLEISNYEKHFSGLFLSRGPAQGCCPVTECLWSRSEILGFTETDKQETKQRSIR